MDIFNKINKDIKLDNKSELADEVKKAVDELEVKKSSNDGLKNTRVMKRKSGTPRVIKVAPFTKWLKEEDAIINEMIKDNAKSKKVVKHRGLSRHTKVAIYSRWNQLRRDYRKQVNESTLQFFKPIENNKKEEEKTGFLSKYFNV